MEAFPFEGYDWAARTKLGEGSYGVVYKVKRHKPEEFVAVKEMNMKVLNEQGLQEALRTEIGVMKELNDDHLLRLHDSHFGQKYTYLVLELCDGDLRKKMNATGGKLTEKDAINVFSQVMKGFKVLTNLGYIHRDIKPQNTLYKGDVYKVSDFGFSCKADIACIKKMNMICGTPLYMSPQLLKEQEYSAKSDIWSLGLMLYEMIFGYGPWICRNLEAYRENITRRPLAFPFDAKIGENTKDFIKRCLEVDESKRIGWDTIFKHVLIKEKDEGEKVQPVDINKSAAEILKRMQSSAMRKKINIKDVLDKKKLQSMTPKTFEQVCRQIDPTIPSFDTRMLFQLLDKSKDGLLVFEEFKDLIVQNDFRPAEDIAGRHLQQLVDVAKRRNIEVAKLFKAYDKDLSGMIDKKEFDRMVKEFLPAMPQGDIDRLWAKFDQDGSKQIQLKEFVHSMTYGVINPQNEKEVDNERTKRCLASLKAAVKYYGVKPQEVISLFDKDKDKLINFKEFCEFVTAIDKRLPEEELQLMFGHLDKNKSGKVDLEELKPILA